MKRMRKELVIIAAIVAPLLTALSVATIQANAQQSGPTCPSGWTLDPDNVHCDSCPSGATLTSDFKCQYPNKSKELITDALKMAIQACLSGGC